MFSGCIWIIHSYDNIVSMGLSGYLSCIFLLFCISLIINTKQPNKEKVSLLKKIKLLRQNKNIIKYILCLIISMFIRSNFFFITGINISEFTYIPLVSFIVSVTLAAISFSLSVILAICKGFYLSIALKHANYQVKESINSSSFLSLVSIVITICLVKFLAFTFIFPYILFMFPTKEGMLHASSQAESSTKVDKDPSSDPDADPNPEPNNDIPKGNNEDPKDSEDSYPYIVSKEWPYHYFRGPATFYHQPFDVYGIYIEPDVDQVLLGTSVNNYFASSKTTIDISQLKNRADLEFDSLNKTWQK